MESYKGEKHLVCKEEDEGCEAYLSVMGTLMWKGNLDKVFEVTQ